MRGKKSIFSSILLIQKKNDHSNMRETVYQQFSVLPQTNIRYNQGFVQREEFRWSYLDILFNQSEASTSELVSSLSAF